MCFSPTASFTVGAVLSVFGGASMKKARRRQDMLFASTPLVFGVQQLAEGVIWMSLRNPAVLSVMTYVYLFFSHVLWPTFVPLSIFLMEPEGWRRRVLKMFVALGCFVSFYFLYFLILETAHVEVVNKSIAYVAPHFFVTFILSPYSVATCASCLFSSHRYVNLFGVLAFLSALAAYHFYHQTFVSVWCFFAAILSIIVYLHLYTQSKGVR
jgi:hypothetical protein